MKKYDFALNPQKLARAIGKKGETASESEVKEEYVSIGGLLASEAAAPVVLEPADDEVPAVVDESLLDENPELKEADVEVGSPVEIVDTPADAAASADQVDVSTDDSVI